MTPAKTLTGRIAAAFIESKLTVLLMLAALVFGFWSVVTTPREENPQISMPAAGVKIFLPGAQPEEVERKAVRPLESLINQIEGVDHVWSVSEASSALITVQFKVGEEKESSLVKLADRVMSGRDKLPKEVVGPFIVSADVDDVPVLAVTFFSDKYGDYGLKRVADSVADHLMGLENISSMEVLGGRNREMTVDIDPVRLESFGLTLESVKGAIAAANLAGPLGSVTEKNRVNQVRLENFIADAEDVKHLVVGISPVGAVVHLSDVASVRDGGRATRTHASRFAYGPADEHYGEASQGRSQESVTLAIAKRKGTNAVVLCEAALARLERMKGTIIPEDVGMEITRNDGVKADDAVNTLIEHLAIALVAVISVTFFFLGVRPAAIVAITVPLILAITLGVVGIAGFTINRLTLYALIIALGLLVDDSIVVIENIVRHYGLSPLKGRQDRLQRSVEAPGEIGSATLLATIAVMLVFASLIPALTGMAKQYFYPVGFSVPVALAASFLIAYTVAPWAAMRWCSVPRPTQKTSLPGGRLGAWYARWARRLIGFPKREQAFLLGVVLLLMLVFLMPAWQLVRPAGPGGAAPFFGIEMSFLPKDNKNTFNVTVQLPRGTPVEVTDRAVRDIALLVADIPEVKNYQTWSGLGGVADFNSMIRGNAMTGEEIGAVRVNLSDKHQRDRSSIVIAQQLREALKPVAAKYEGISVQVVEDPPGPPQKGTVYAEVYAEDGGLLQTLSQRVEEAFRSTYDMVEVTKSMDEEATQWVIRVDRDKAALSGVSTVAAAQELQNLISETTAARAHAAGERREEPIRLRVLDEAHFDPALLRTVTVPSLMGARVPLSAIVTVTEERLPHKIEKKDGVRMTAVGGELAATASTYAVLDLNERLQGMALPEGGRLKTGNLTWSDERADLTLSRAVLLWQGEMRMMLDSYRDLAISLCLSIGSIFLILVAYYQSFGLALIALSAVPLCFIGMFPGHWLMSTQFSASSLIGVTALSGVVVRSSLLIIDFVIGYLKEGLPLKDAVIDAGAVRLRPILLTTLAIILGSLILMPDPVFGGLAITFVFGTAASTALTIFLIPLLLRWYFQRFPFQTAEKSS